MGWLNNKRDIKKNFFRGISFGQKYTANRKRWLIHQPARVILTNASRACKPILRNPCNTGDSTLYRPATFSSLLPHQWKH